MSASRAHVEPHLIRYAALAFAAQMMVNLCNFAFHVIVSRRIGVSAYGALNALVAAFNVCAVPAVIMTTLLAKRIAELQAELRSADIAAFARNSISRLLAVAVAVSVLCSILAPVTARFLNLTSIVSVWLTAGILGLNLALPLRGILQGLEDYPSFAVSLVSEAAIKVVLSFILTSAGYGLDGALLGWLVGTVVSYLYTVARVLTRYCGAAARHVHFPVFRISRETLSVAAATLSVTSLGFSDLVLVKHLFAPGIAGIYGAAALSGRMIYFLVSFVPIVLLPRAAHLSKEGKSTSRILFQALAAVAALSGPALLVYYAHPGAIVTALAGPAYYSAAALVFPYAVAAALLGVVNALAYYRLGVSDFGFVLPLSVVAICALAGMWVFHRTPFQVIEVLIVFNSLAIVASAWGAGAKMRGHVGAARKARRLWTAPGRS